MTENGIEIANGENTTSVIAALAAKFKLELGKFLGAGKRVALLDFPDHSNVGDSAIWLGEVFAIRELIGCDPVYASSISDYSKKELAESVGNGLILIHGGGNFGDIWVEHQDFREQVCIDFPNNKIVQLPQSIWFESTERMQLAAGVFANHGDFHLMVRDNQSYEIAKDLGCEVLLVPDAAFCIGPINGSRKPIAPSMVLSRTDKEKSSTMTDMMAFADPRSRHSDWLEEDVAVIWALIDYKTEREGKFAAWKAAAEYRLARGIEILSFGEKVITDRLHGYILAVLLGLPVVIFDNNYGKISKFIETWRNFK